MTVSPDLSALTLDELVAMAAGLDLLGQAGRVLAKGGCAPVFDVTPGRAARILTAFTMPGCVMSGGLRGMWGTPPVTGVAPGPLVAVEPAATPVEAVVWRAPEAVPPTSTPVDGPAMTATAPPAPAVSEPGPEPASGPSAASSTPQVAAGGSAPGAPAAAMAAAVAGAANPDPREVPGKPAEADGEAPAGASRTAGAAEPPGCPPRATTRPDRWSEDEDRRAVEIAVAAVRAGGLRSHAAKAVAAELGRPVPGVLFRLNNALRERIEAALRVIPPAAAPMPVPEPPAEPAPVPPPAQAQASPPRAEDAVAAVIAHLRGLPKAPLWPAARDLDLMEDACGGLDMKTIAIRLETDPKSVVWRFDQLTRRRDFPREAVRDALRAMQGVPA